MTTVAWDGHTLAADKRSCFGTLIHTVTKIYRVRGCLVAGAGDFDRIQETVAWFESGADPAKLPPFQRDNNDFVGLVVIQPDKTILRYERGPYPFKIESPFYAMGSGRDFAMAAMHLGKTASEAVEVAMALDSGSGNGIDTMTLADTSILKQEKAYTWDDVANFSSKEDWANYRIEFVIQTKGDNRKYKGYMPCGLTASERQTAAILECNRQRSLDFLIFTTTNLKAKP